MALSRLKRRPDFLRVARAGLKAAAPGLVLQVYKRGDGGDIRVGFTASKRIGSAVARNRARRRLRSAAEAVLPQSAAPACDYVLIARRATAKRPYPALLRDLAGALKRLGLSKGTNEETQRRA